MPGLLYEACLLARVNYICDDIYTLNKGPVRGKKKVGNFSLIERVILSARAMLIFSVYFHLTICPEGRNIYSFSSI
ncbi:hypothetical protein N7463_006979 [Penicillium fimorum]|uniref:Uncharacterized protein n=1 Tax=Penicillium fimorum TaxID=1882269 RepID=A0A9W9XX22_9EURO|nr:hypothetical protein N7463_006979 [Penicillium fimorum]